MGELEGTERTKSTQVSHSQGLSRLHVQRVGRNEEGDHTKMEKRMATRCKPVWEEERTQAGAC